MDASEIKKDLHKYIDEADKDQLNFLAEAVQAYALNKEDKKPYKFNPNSTTPMSLNELNDLIDRAEEGIRIGKVYTHEEVRKMLVKRNVRV